MSDLPTFSCSHNSEFRIEYYCKDTGNYVLELCKKCRESESNDFLVIEERIS